MECIVCRKKIEYGEKIFWISPVLFCGPGDDDVVHTEPSENFLPAVHHICLERPAEAVYKSGTGTPDPVVQRSDALDMFDGI